MNDNEFEFDVLNESQGAATESTSVCSNGTNNNNRKTLLSEGKVYFIF